MRVTIPLCLLLLAPHEALAQERALPSLPGPFRLSLGLWGGQPWGAWLGLSVPLGAATRPAASEPERPSEPLPAARLKRLARAAWKSAGVEEERLARMASRARQAALLPEVRLRALRSDDLMLRYAETADDARAQSTGQAGTSFEVRLTFRLDRLLFAEEEVAIERLRQEAQQQRARLNQRLAELLAAWRKSSARASDASLSPEARAEAQVEVEAASAALDLLTDGAWSSTAAAP